MLFRSAEAGHTVTPLQGSLVPLQGIIAAGMPCVRLQGLSLRNVSLTVFENDKKIYTDFGELLFTHFGVSGPLVLSASAHMRHFTKKRYRLEIDLKPALDRSKLADRIAREIGSLGPQAEIRQLLRRLLPPQLIPLAAATCRLSPSQLLASLDKRDGERIASVLKSLRIPVSDYRPFSEAIVTAGGVSTEEVDPETMQSRLVGGLYLAGELLDIDADTGGYNLQIAYSTGHLAGELLASQSI